MSEQIDFSDITRDDILKAFKKYDEMEQNKELNNKRKSKEYLLFWNSKEYPHKYIVGIAYGLKYNQEPLDNTYYNSMRTQKSSAQWCIEKNGFVLYADKKYKEYLQKRFDKQITINTYYSDLKKAIKIFQNIEKLKNKNLNEIFSSMGKGDVTFDEYDKSQKELGFNDKQLFSTLKTKAKVYMEAINEKNNMDIMTKKDREENMPNNTKQPLNQILYGPPGTGKTYNTINKAIEIIENRSVNDDANREELKAKFEEYKKAGQIEFITFHQSYGYEEFVEGIKAKTNQETKKVEYEIEAGIFKKLANNAKPIKAQSNKLNFDWNRGNIFKMSLGGKNDADILDWCIDNEYISMGWGNEIDFSKITAQNWEDFRDKAKSLYQNTATDRFTLQAMYAFKEWMKKDDLVFISLGNLKIVAIGQVIGDYEYKENIDEISYSQFRKVKWLFIDKAGISVEKLLNKKLSQQTIYNLDKSYVKKDFLHSLFSENEKDELKNYILIIDEINRGNISKIFGELITLIEPSKRIGADEEIRVKLPYSGDTEEPFGVPQNLYIIGTMNTADRSIAQIDTALRRRFEFIEMLPKPELLVNEQNEPLIILDVEKEIYIQNILQAINERIEYIYDREHQIGHSYFMSLLSNPTKEKLDEIFRVNIIPLLAEYFYGDWADIKFILNDTNHNFITVKDDTQLNFAISESRRRKNKIYNVNPNEFSIEAYQNIYVLKS